MILLTFFIKLNALYDIACAAAMLKFIHVKSLQRIHLRLLKDYEYDNPVLERFYAYWIFTYGCARLSENPYIIAASYYIEAIVFTNECYRHKTIKKDVGTLLIATCIMLGYNANLLY
jgi:hypothetical protein